MAALQRAPGAHLTGIRRRKCPPSIVAGRHDDTTPSEPVMRWFDTVQAPSKRFVWFGNSAHYTQDRGRVLIHLAQEARPPVVAVAVGDAEP